MNLSAGARLGLGLVLSGAVLGAAHAAPVWGAEPKADAERWRREAAQTQIVRDDWGIAHVHGRTDADAVFGMAFAQSEDDFNRIETNYLNALGRLAEAEGEKAVYQDLRQRLFVDPEALKASYRQSPTWLRKLMDAWADGLNYYLATHPSVHPRVLRRFEPWMALSFSEGSIGGDIERVSLERLEAFYKETSTALLTSDPPETFREPRGSNGIAIAPANTRDGHALLLINPHTSFYFRSELQMTSDEGLNAYGAVTWGQFFVYQGFNPHLGWMHTSSGVDNVDEFAETIVRKDDGLFYRYGPELRPIVQSTIKIVFRRSDGGIGARTFTVFRTHHGPVVRNQGDRWVSIALMQKPVAALEQSFLRTKAETYAQYAKVLELKANSSNNTIFADAQGDIAYLHPQFVPRRDDRFDYTRPVDGSDPATDWRGLHALSELPHVLNPKVGWIMNTNDWPYSAAGPDSPRRADFPRYMDRVGENPRGVHAALILKDRRDFTLESLNAAAFDSYLPAFADLLPPLFAAYDALAPNAPDRAALQEPVAVLRAWDRRWSAASEATALAVFWGEILWNSVATDAVRSARGPDPGPEGCVRSSLGRLRVLAHAVGPDQSLPEAHGRHHRPVR
jgi:acyl-homoserine-lactone acylase